MRQVSIALSCLLCLCVLRSAAVAEEGPLDAVAQAHLDAGRRAYQEGDYATALEELKAADLGQVAPVVAYELARTNERLGRRYAAVRAYRRYLTATLDPADRAAVEASIDRLEHEALAGLRAREEQLDDADPETVVVTPRMVQATPVDPFVGGPVVSQTHAPRRRWIYVVLAAGAVVALGAVIAVGVASHHANPSPPSAGVSRGIELPRSPLQIHF